MLSHALIEIREAQVPLLSAMLLAGCAAKAGRVLRVGSVDAGLGPTALFPLRLRRQGALALCAIEFICGSALIITAGRLGRGDIANTVRLATALLFLVATCALIELRANHPDAGCGCFGELSRTPVSGRTLARSAFLAAAALATIGLPPLQAPHPGVDAARGLGIFAIEFAVIAALSPELSEALVRLGYSEPCELRRLPAVRTLAALRRSAQWRRRSGLITEEVPVDMWRELCWRYVVFPARLGAREAEIVFAVYLRPHRPAIHAALVDSATGDVLSWPAAPARRGVAGWLARAAGRLAEPGRLLGPHRRRTAEPGLPGGHGGLGGLASRPGGAGFAWPAEPAGGPGHPGQGGHPGPAAYPAQLAYPASAAHPGHPAHRGRPAHASHPERAERAEHPARAELAGHPPHAEHPAHARHPGRSRYPGLAGPPADDPGHEAGQDPGDASDPLRIPAGVLSAPTDPGDGIPVFRVPPYGAGGGADDARPPGPRRPPDAPRTPPGDLPLSSDL